MNEILQWAAIVVLTLLTLGVLRQLSLMLPPAVAMEGSGPDVGASVPSRLLKRLRSVMPNEMSDDGATLAFVTENCTGCRRLLSDLSNGRRRPVGPIAVVAHQPSDQFRAALEELNVPVLADDGEFWRAWRISATPLVVRIDGAGRVDKKEVTHDVSHVAEVSS